MSEVFELRDPEDVIISDGRTLADMINDHREWLKSNHTLSDRLCIIGKDLSYVNFKGMDLREVVFVDDDFTRSSFDHCMLGSARFINSIIDHTIFNCANLSSAAIIECSALYSSFNNAHMHSTILNYTECNSSTFINAGINRANLSVSSFEECKFESARCHYSTFYKSHFYSSDFNASEIIDSDFTESILSYADFSNAYIADSAFYHAWLLSANFEGAIINSGTSFCRAYIEKDKNISYPNLPIACPEEGSFIGFKVGLNSIDLSAVLIKLEIMEDAKRSSGTRRKCRADKVKVLDIIDINTEKHETEAISIARRNFKYKVGEVIQIDDFDENRWKECSTGIHFFITKDEALRYAKENGYITDITDKINNSINGSR